MSPTNGWTAMSVPESLFVVCLLTSTVELSQNQFFLKANLVSIFFAGQDTSSPVRFVFRSVAMLWSSTTPLRMNSPPQRHAHTTSIPTPAPHQLLNLWQKSYTVSNLLNLPHGIELYPPWSHHSSSCPPRENALVPASRNRTGARSQD